MANFTFFYRANLKLVILSICILSACSSSENDNVNDDINDIVDDDNPVTTCSEFVPPSGVNAFDDTTIFPNWTISKYNLPYASGESYLVGQGNTTGFGHSGFWRYGYDFHMDIGTEILAARGGVVIHANDGTTDGDPNGTNLITIRHDDGTVALYSHFTLNGVLVEPGDNVNQGDLIGLSGNTGNTGGIPHLHFSVHPCSQLPGLSNQGNCPTQPITFKNTEPNPKGLGTGQCYKSD